ncbi:unnamed protein product, partial [Ascophyllum nodosum]
MGLEDVPRRYRRPILHLLPPWVRWFDFARYNNTEYAGLENAPPTPTSTASCRPSSLCRKSGRRLCRDPLAPH